MTDIWKEHWTIRRARAEKAREEMLEYDTDVYQPAMLALQAKCAAIGHMRGTPQGGAFGDHWHICSLCGARLDGEEA